MKDVIPTLLSDLFKQLLCFLLTAKLLTLVIQITHCYAHFTFCWKCL